MTNPETVACRTTQHCAHHGWCRRCDPEFAAVMSRVNVAIQRTDGDETHWGPLYAAVAEALRPAAVSVPPPAPRAADRAAAPTDWIDGHPQLEAIAAAVWERCEHHDSGLIIDDPRNIAVAAYAAVLPDPTDRAAEDHRLALSMALNLGTSAPWDAIHDRATELGLPPLDQDPVAQRLGLLAAYRATLFTEAADAVFALDYDVMVGEEGDENLGSMREAWDLGTIHAEKLLRRLAAEAPTTTKPETEV